MGLHTSAISFFSLFHALSRVLFGEPNLAPEASATAVNVAAPTITAAAPFNEFWFGHPDSPGAIAIGMAEGTRTIDGVRTAAWYGHTDPGNRLHNVGTFSRQHTNLTPDDADVEELSRIRRKLSQFIQNQPNLSPLEYLAAADLSVQARDAFPAFGQHLKVVSQHGMKPVAAIVEARMRSFYNPRSGELEAAGFRNDAAALRRDQLRRTRELARKVRYVDRTMPEAMTIAHRR